MLPLYSRQPFHLPMLVTQTVNREILQPEEVPFKSLNSKNVYLLYINPLQQYIMQWWLHDFWQTAVIFYLQSLSVLEPCELRRP